MLPCTGFCGHGMSVTQKMCNELLVGIGCDPVTSLEVTDLLLLRSTRPIDVVLTGNKYGIAVC